MGLAAKGHTVHVCMMRFMYHETHDIVKELADDSLKKLHVIMHYGSDDDSIPPAEAEVCVPILGSD